MNRLVIIGNLTRDPELRTVSGRDGGVSVCSFTLAVNRRNRGQNADGQDADFFRVTAWRGLGENCAKYLSKGRKAAVVGPVSVSTYAGQDGQTRASLEVTAEDVEFLSSRNEGTPQGSAGAKDASGQASYERAEREAIQNEDKYVRVEMDELPF